MARGEFFKNIFITVQGDFGPMQKFDKIDSWVSQRAGKCKKSITADTTHLLISEKVWKAQGPLIDQARDRGDIKIVTFDWLSECLHKKRKLATKQYEWATVDKDMAKRMRQKKKLEERQRKKAGNGLSLPRGSLTAELRDDLSRFNSEGDDQTLLGKYRKSNNELHTDRGDRMNAARPPKVPFTDTHHVYIDETGFKYRITLFKVETSLNINERYTITLWESNTEPRTYSCWIHNEGQMVEPARSAKPIAMTTASNLPTSMREFKEQFEHKTKYSWDQRLKCSANRTVKIPEEPARRSGFITNSDVIALGGAPAPDTIWKDEAKKLAFERLPFTYKNPPVGEPQGEVPPECAPTPGNRGDGSISPFDLELGGSGMSSYYDVGDATPSNAASQAATPWSPDMDDDMVVEEHEREEKHERVNEHEREDKHKPEGEHEHGHEHEYGDEHENENEHKAKAMTGEAIPSMEDTALTSDLDASQSMKAGLSTNEDIAGTDADRTLQLKDADPSTIGESENTTAGNALQADGPDMLLDESKETEDGNVLPPTEADVPSIDMPDIDDTKQSSDRDESELPKTDVVMDEQAVPDITMDQQE